MTTKFGLHVNQGSRNGYGPVVSAAPAVVLSVNEGGCLLEAREKSGGRTITIFRDTTVFHDAPPGVDSMSVAQAQQTAEQYWPLLKAKYQQNPADYYQTTNELGGDNPTTLRNLAAFETRLMELAERDGYKLAIGSPAGGSPGNWELWLQFYVPLIRRAGQGGHIYSRHAYGGVESGSSGYLTRSNGSPADANAGRPFVEAAYLREQGILTPMVITEAGQNGGYQFPGVDAFLADVARYDALCRQHASIWGFCAWTYGNYQNFPANIQDASGAMRDYLTAQGGAVRPAYPDPAIIEEGPMDLHEFLWQASRQEQLERGIHLNPHHGLEQLVYERERYQVVHREISVTAPDGNTYGLMAAEHLAGTGPRIVLYFKRPWSGPGGVTVLTDPAAVPFSSPVGTVEERQSGKIWPGDWVDATGYGTRYQITSGGSYHRHTGADLNLNKPTWNADKGMPVHASGAGVVTYARHVPAPSTWGRLVVIRHTLPDGKVLHTRYAHMGSMLVQEGQQVLRGDVLGTINAAGLAVGQDHLHFDVSHSGILENDPRHWPYDSLASVAANYLNPKLFLEGKADALVEPAQSQPGPTGTIGLVGSLPYNVNSPYPFAPPRELATITTIVIHHSDGPSNQSALAIADYHTRTRNWPEISYHYLIAGDGKIHRTNLPETISYHASSANGTSLGVCLAGSFMDGARPTAAQLASCRTLVNWLRDRLPGVQVVPHLAVGATDCPGNTWTAWWEVATGEGPSAPTPAPGAIDLLPYIRGDGRAYMVRHPSGAQEKFRTEVDGPWFYLVKNNQFEQFRFDSQYIWRGLDSSPGPAPDYAERPGQARFYAQREPGNDAARWCPRHMAVGATWAGPGHHVQFYYKSDCSPSSANSGNAQNVTRFVARHASKMWNGITVYDVIELDGGPGSPEKFFFARAQGEFAGGLAAWDAGWGSSAVSELNVAPDNQRETIPC